jgi:hypothetical protein
VLANFINGLPFHPIASEIEDAFKAYKKERIEWVKKAFSSSAMFRTQAGPVSVKITNEREESFAPIYKCNASCLKDH